MFSALRDLVPPAKPSLKTTSAEKFSGQNVQINTALYAAAKISLAAKIASMTATADDFTNLRLLKGIITTHGLNRSLLKFAYNKKGGLGFLLPGAPANESMLDEVSTSASDPRATQMVDGIDTVLETQPKMVSDWIRSAAASMESMMMQCSNQMGWMETGVDHYTQAMDAMDYDADAVAKSSCCAMSCDQAMSCMEALCDVMPDLDAACPDPTDRDAMDEHKQMLVDRAAKLGEHTGLHMADGNLHQMEISEPVDNAYPMMTMSELGYDMDSTTALLAKVSMLLAAVKDLLERKDMIMAQMNAAADLVDSLDNDVPPALDDMLIANEDVGDGNMMTQADVMHCHMSSHMCCMSACMDTAMSMMQNAMTVCNHMCMTCASPSQAAS